MEGIIHLKEWKLAREISEDNKKIDFERLYAFLCDPEVKKLQNEARLEELYEKQLEYDIAFEDDVYAVESDFDE